MTVKEYIHASNLSPLRLSELLGYKSTSPITRRMDEEMPERWARKLDELSDLGIVSPIADGNSESNNESERAPNPLTDEQISDWISNEGRTEDKDPNVNNADNSGVEVIGPQKIKLTTIKGYIEMMYGAAETIARKRGDHIAAETIQRYTPEYTEAWIDYIKYDTRIIQLLEKLEIGTPLGNLVGIHAISIGAYVLARVTAKELATIAAQNGTGESEL